MSRSLLHVVTLACALTLGACASGHQPQFKVLSIEKASSRPASDMVLFVEVVNRAERPLELQRLQYSFARSVEVKGVEPIHGDIRLSRTVEAGAAVVVEVPLPYDQSLPIGEELLLAGRLYATQDRLQRSFDVQARVTPPQ
ncbi:MAG: hypothetical protein R3B06_23680 [Kofleriaceae bacterium]